MSIDKKTGDIKISNEIKINKNTSKIEVENIENIEKYGNINGYETYSIKDTTFLNLKMRINFRFKDNYLFKIELIWTDGKVNISGYNVTNLDLSNEKEYLSNKISQAVEELAEITTTYEDCFSFPWGYILIKADQKSLSCLIDIIYK
ncbi:hypothetical protein [Janthinobacterium sp. PC23-8]|uniref:hypothetical protein n=1 Tax=Janthinobacterium sp. PC23-8 TaxID=2012679 RepID=UPI00113FDE77|nr:hypothetical protein [Janthinobacterium sp. PC23-8]